LGDGWKLVGQHGMRPIVLSCRGIRKSPGPPPPAEFTVRDAERDLLRPFDPQHPDPRLMEAAPELLRCLKEAVSAWDLNDLDQSDDSEAGEAMADWKAVIAQAEGRQ
jgi:hypothetical protein